MIKQINYCRLSRAIDTNSQTFTDMVVFVKNEVNKWFANPNHKSICVQDLFGGDNYEWHKKGFPIAAYWDAFNDQYYDAGYTEEESEAMAVKQAGIAVGYLLKYVLLKDPVRTYEQRKEFMHNVYHLI